MIIQNCNFERWAENHSDKHKDRIFRELYPYAIFSKINFSEENLGIEQKIEFNGIEYYSIIKKIELQKNNKYRTLFILSAKPKSNTQSWKNRIWDERFQIVYSQNFEFITVFTKNEDPSKDYIKRFYKGNFQKLVSNRSIPLSALLFRTLISTLSEDLFDNGDYYQEFEIIKDGYRTLPITRQKEFKIKQTNYFSPIFSQGRKLWICLSFNEEKAHRIGFFNANQCDQLYVIFCNPTYKKHHRCKYPKVHIISIYEFVAIQSEQIEQNYIKQIRFLQNHLNEQKEYSEQELLKEINNPKLDNYEIYKSELMEALAIMKIIPNSEYQLFHYLTSMNLLNAWIGRNKKEKKNKLFSEMYFFKSYLAKVIEKLISENNFGAKIYLEKNLAMIELNSFNFSFHHIKMSSEMIEYMVSNKNQKIEWSKQRLQPISSLLFKYSKERKKSVANSV
jgi:hypothetical protein